MLFLFHDLANFFTSTAFKYSLVTEISSLEISTISFWVGILIYHYRILFKPRTLVYWIEATIKLLDLERLS